MEISKVEISTKVNGNKLFSQEYLGKIFLNLILAQENFSLQDDPLEPNLSMDAMACLEITSIRLYEHNVK